MPDDAAPGPAGVASAGHATPVEGRDRSRFNTFPAPSAPLIGRSDEVAAIEALFERDGVRMVTLVGPGGVGKTRLAIEIGHRRATTTPDGARFVDLSSLRDPALVIPTIADALGVREEAERSPVVTLSDALRQRRMFLILDNLEQVAACAADLGRLIVACPDVTVLATSRLPLRLRAEHLFAVPPLPVPDDEAVDVMAEAATLVARSPAAALYLERVRATNPAFLLSDQEAPDVAAICRRLDGLPLALELAAGWSRVLTPAALLARLEDRLSLLHSGPIDLPERQQTLRDAIGWSYDLLSPADRRLFRRLAVFAGGCATDAAVEVGGADEAGQGESATLAGLASLVDHNLLRAVTAAGQRRFAMLETIRAFGVERLRAEGEAEEVNGAHARSFRRLAEAAEAALWGGPEQGAWLDRLTVEIANLRAAFDWALRAGHTDVALGLAAPLGLLLRTRGSLREARERLERVLGAATSQPDATMAGVASVAATVAMTQGDLDRATELGEAGLAAWRGLAEGEGIARCLNVLGGCALLAGNLALAASRLDEALALRRGLADEAGVASVLLNLGAVAVLRGDATAATAFLEEAREIAHRLGDKTIEALGLRQLGELAQSRGDYPRATELGEAALQLDRELGDKGDAAWSLVRLGSVALDEGAPDRAERFLGEALDLAREVGDEPAVGEALVLLGRAAARAGEAERAEQALRGALAAGRALDNPVIVGTAQTALGDLARSRGDGADASDRYRAALALHAEGDDLPGLLGPLAGVALLAAQGGMAEPAARLLGSIEALRETIGVALPTAERAEHDRAVAALRGKLGRQDVAVLWQAGRARSGRDAVGDAMALLAEVPAVVAPSRPPARGGATTDNLLPAGLSEREGEVLRLVAGGLTNAEVADKLFLSPHTVSAHLRRIYGKLDVTSRSAATRFAIEHGLA